MRKEFADYHFYKISCIDDDIELCYVGSTSNWKLRNKHHKTCCNNKNNKEYNCKKYHEIRENGGWSNFKMVEIGFRENLTLREAQKIEEEYRVEHRAKLNDRKCFTTEDERKQIHKEWRKNNPDKLKIHNKEKWERHGEKYNARVLEKVECECGAVVARGCLSRHKKSKKHLNRIPTEPS